MADNGRGQLLKHKSNGVYTATTEPANPKWGFLLALSGIAMTVGTAIPVGYHIGIINAPAAYIQTWCNQSLIDRYDLHLTGDELDVLWSTIVSAFTIGGCIGSLVAAFLADRFGRKGSLLICGIMFAISAVMFFFCRLLASVELLLLARLIVGLSSGITTAVLAMYFAEIAPSELRGTLATFSGMGVTAGVVVAQVASLQELLGTEEHWHYALSAYLVLVIVCFVPYPWLPESPKYLYIVAGKQDQARNELTRLRAGTGSGDDLSNRINNEIVAMEQEAVTQAESRSIYSVVTDRSLLLPVVLVCAAQCGQQLSGVNAVFYYSVDIFIKAGLSHTSAKWANFGAGCLNLATSLTGPKIMEKCDRRPIFMYSCLFSGIFLVCLTFVRRYVDEVSWFPMACVFLVFAYILAYQIGLGPIPYFIGSELFEISARPAAMAVGSLSSWAGNFYVAMTFLSLSRAIGAFVFLQFAAVCFLLVALTYRYLPETRGKEPADITPLVADGFKSRRH